MLFPTANLGMLARLAVDLTAEAYQFTSPNALVVPQILFEVEVVHVVENESQRVLGGREYSDKRRDVPALEMAIRQRLVVEPL